MKTALFLDRDGTLIEDRDYLRRPEEVVIFNGAAAALKRAQDAGILLVMITNQSGVGRGYFTLDDVVKVHDHLAAELLKEGVRLEKIYVAPEAPGQVSRGRKPSPQFLFDARDELGVNLERSFIVGDKIIDLECGWNAGVRQAILVRTGYGRKSESALGGNAGRTVVVDDLPAAVDWILKAETSR